VGGKLSCPDVPYLRVGTLGYITLKLPNLPDYLRVGWVL